jgi:hypothetical protein
MSLLSDRRQAQGIVERLLQGAFSDGDLRDAHSLAIVAPAASSGGREYPLRIAMLEPVVSKLPIHHIAQRNATILASLAVANDQASRLDVVDGEMDRLAQVQSAAVDQPQRLRLTSQQNQRLEPRLTSDVKKKRLLLALTRAGADKCKFVSYFLELFELSENVGSVFGSFHCIVFVDDVALLIDDKCPAHRRDAASQCVGCSGDFTFDGSAVFGGDSEKLGNVSVDVGEEGEV